MVDFRLRPPARSAIGPLVPVPSEGNSEWTDIPLGLDPRGQHSPQTTIPRRTQATIGIRAPVPRSFLGPTRLCPPPVSHARPRHLEPGRRPRWQYNGDRQPPTNGRRPDASRPSAQKPAQSIPPGMTSHPARVAHRYPKVACARGMEESDSPGEIRLETPGEDQCIGRTAIGASGLCAKNPIHASPADQSTVPHRRPVSRPPRGVQGVRSLKNAGGGSRTHTPLRAQDFESSASANSATPAALANAAAACLLPRHSGIHEEGLRGASSQNRPASYSTGRLPGPLGPSGQALTILTLPRAMDQKYRALQS